MTYENTERKEEIAQFICDSVHINNVGHREIEKEVKDTSLSCKLEYDCCKNESYNTCI